MRCIFDILRLMAMVIGERKRWRKEERKKRREKRGDPSLGGDKAMRGPANDITQRGCINHCGEAF